MNESRTVLLTRLDPISKLDRRTSSAASVSAGMKESSKRRARFWPYAIVGLVVVSGVIGWLAADGENFDWIAATAAATAYGTLALAGVTWSLVKRTEQLVVNAAQDASDTRKLAKIAAREQA